VGNRHLYGLHIESLKFTETTVEGEWV